MKALFMHPVVFSCAAALAISLSGCASSSSSTSSGTLKYDAAKEVKSLKTYAWLPDRSGASENPYGNSGYWRGEIQTAIGEQLAAKGFQEAPVADADFQVAFHIVLKKGDVVTYLNNYKGYPLKEVFAGPKDSLKKFGANYSSGIGEQGTLIIDFVDEKNKHLLYRSWVQTELHREEPAEELKAKVRAVVRQATKKLPGSSK